MVSSSTVGAARGRVGLILALLALGQLIVALDYNIVYLALPDIGRALGFSAQNQQWVVSAYTVVYGGFLLLGGRASDLLGRRRMFMAGLVVYALSSLAGGLATGEGMLIGARAAQGIGGALLFPATLSLVHTTFAEGRDRNRAVGVWATAGAAGMVLGSLLGGLLTQTLGWAAVFWVNVPLAGIALALAIPLLPKDSTVRKARAFDLPGALAVTVGMTSLVFALVQGPEYGWTSPSVLAAAATGVVLLVVFVVIERRGRDPLLPLRMLRHRSLSAGVVTTFLFMATFGSLVYFLMQYFQVVRGYGPLLAGVAYLVPMVGVVVGSNLGGRLATRYGVRATLSLGLLTGCVGVLGVAVTMSPNGTFLALAGPALVFGLGQGVVYTTMFAAAASGVPEDRQGVASAMASAGMQIGNAVGLAVLVAVANSVGGLAGLRAAAVLVVAGVVAMLVVARAFPTPQAIPAAVPDRVAA